MPQSSHTQSSSQLINKMTRSLVSSDNNLNMGVNFISAAFLYCHMNIWEYDNITPVALICQDEILRKSFYMVQMTSKV